METFDGSWGPELVDVHAVLPWLPVAQQQQFTQQTKASVNISSK